MTIRNLATTPGSDGPPALRCNEARIFEFGDFRLDGAQRQILTGEGRPVDLPSRAFDLLLFMVERPGQLLNKSTLLKGVWPTTVVEEGNLSQCIFALRRALDDTAHNRRFIATVPGRGYQFVAQVRTSIARIPDELPPESATAAFRTFGERRALWIASGITALALIGSTAWLISPRADALGARTSSAENSSAVQTIAILPFDDFSVAHDMEDFTDGIAEELLISLTKVDSLRVIGRGFGIASRDTNEDARSIGAKLHVDSVLEGSVRKSGERIRISARLVRTHDGISLWSETYDLKLNEALDIQSAIASEVAAALSPMTVPGSSPS